LTGEVLRNLSEGSFVGPGIHWVQNLVVNSVNMLRDLEVESWDSLVFNFVKVATVDIIDKLSGNFQAHSLSNSVLSAGPSGVHKPHVGIILLDLLSEHLSIGVWMEREESFSETSREGRFRIYNTHLSSSNLGGVSTDEMVHSLLEGELGDWRKDSISIASQEDNVGWVSTLRRKLGIIDVLEGIASSSIFSNLDIIKINGPASFWFLEVLDVLDDSSELKSSVDIWLLLL